MSAPSPGERRLRAAALVALAVAAVVLVTHWAPRAVDPSAVPDPCALVDCGADAGGDAWAGGPVDAGGPVPADAGPDAPAPPSVADAGVDP